MKIVSLFPSATEIVFALGLGGDLEGVTYECDFPDEARSKPVVSDTALPRDRPIPPGEIDRVVGSFMERQEPIYVLDRRLIQSIQPDLILAQDLCHVCAVPSGQVQDALDELGCSSEVISLDPHTIGDILDGIIEVGRATGTEGRAEELVDELRERVERVRVAAAALPSVRVFCLEWGDPPFAAGHWVPGMVEIAGGTHVLNPPGQPSRRTTWSEVRQGAPEVVVFMPCGYSMQEAEAEAEALFRITELSDTPAVRRGNLFVVDATSHFSRPGPRIVDGLEVLAWAMHPEAFPQPPSDRVVRVTT